MARRSHRWLEAAGRAAMAGIFIKAGWEALKEPGGRSAKAEALGLPEPELMVRANGGAMLLGGAALATGVLSRPAAVGLVASLIPTTVAGHAFWNEDDPTARATQRIQFLKNLGLMGGLMIYLARSGSD